MRAVLPRSEKRRRGALLLSLLLLGFLAACAGKYSGAWDLAGYPGLLFDVKRYYQANAIEEFGRCRNPLLEGVTAATVLEDTPERLAIRVRYLYRDLFQDWDEDCDDRDGIFGRMCRTARVGNPTCRGFNERTFVVDKRGEELEIVAMTGERGGRASFGR